MKKMCRSTVCAIEKIELDKTEQKLSKNQEEKKY